MGKPLRAKVLSAKLPVNLPEDRLRPQSVHDVKSSGDKPLCRMIERKVPVFSSLWFGTGTVTVVSEDLLCMMTWLPHCRITQG